MKWNIFFGHLSILCIVSGVAHGNVPCNIDSPLDESSESTIVLGGTVRSYDSQRPHFIKIDFTDTAGKVWAHAEAQIAGGGGFHVSVPRPPAAPAKLGISYSCE